MSIFSSIGNAVKSYAKNVVGGAKIVGSAVKSAFNTAGSKSQGASALQATTTSSALNQAKASASARAAKDVSTYNTQTKAAQDASTKKNIIKGGTLGMISTMADSGSNVKNAMSNFSSMAKNKVASANVPTTYDAISLSSDINAFDTPSYISSNLDSGIGSYLGASSINAGGNMGMSGSTVGAGSTIGANGIEKTADEIERDKLKKKQDEYNQSIMDSYNELIGIPEKKDKLEEQAGIPAATAELRDLQAKQTMQTAQYMSQMQDIQNKPIAMEFIAGQQGEVQRRAGIDAMITSALVQSKQGQIQTAQDTIDKAIKLKYDTALTALDAKKFILEANYKDLSSVDKKIADAKTSLIDLQKTQTTYDRDIRKSLIDNILKGMNDGTIESSDGNAQISSIMNEDTKLSDVFKSFGVTGQGNPGLVNGYDITSYATDPNHETKINAIVKGINITNSTTAQEVINKYAKNSPITGSMIINSANKYKVDPNVMFALMLNDSSLGTAGKAVRTLNPGNVGNDDAGNTRTYSSWGAGVDGVAEWLSKHKAKKLYNGEFADTINNIVTFEPQKSQKTVQKNLQSQIANGNYASAYNQMQNSVSKGLTGENKTRYDSARIDVNVLSNLQKTLTQYENAGGDTNLLKGSVEKITRKLGALKTDPKFAQLAVQMEREFQNYRNQMTGAAFTPEESREYEAVNPSGKKSFDLNSSVITGAVNQLRNRVYSTEEALAGDGLKYIREYAMGIDPLLLQMNNAITGGGPTVSNSDYFNNLP